MFFLKQMLLPGSALIFGKLRYVAIAALIVLKLKQNQVGHDPLHSLEYALILLSFFFWIKH